MSRDGAADATRRAGSSPGAWRDTTIVPLVWNDTREGGAREDINVLLSRLRRDLVTGNVASAILERAPGGRATRFVVAPGASVREID